MESFLYLFIKLLPVYLYIFIGYVLKLWLNLSNKFVSKALFWFCVPLVVFRSTLKSNIIDFISLVALSFITSVIMMLLAKILWKKSNKDLPCGVFQGMHGSFNIGWFGIPIVYALFGEQALITMTALYIGGMLFGNTLCYWVVANASNQSIKSSYKIILSIPSLYAMLLGFILQFLGYENISNYPIISFVFFMATNLTSFFGMAIIGMSLVGIKLKHIVWKNLSNLLINRILLASFIVVCLASIFYFLELITIEQIKIYLLMPILPIAANLLVFINNTNNNHNATQISRLVGFALFVSTIISCLLFIILIIGNYIINTL